MRQTISEHPYTAEELSMFCSQVALVLRSGMFLPDGVAAMAQEGNDPVLNRIRADVERDGKLGRALQNTRMFPDYMVRMVLMGEEAGKLEQVMNALAKYYSREHAVRSQIKSAVFYPMVLVALMIVVIGVLLIKVLPVFADVFADLGNAAAAGSVAAFGTLAGYIALGLAVALLFFGVFLTCKLRSAKGYASLMNSFSKFGPTKKLAEKVATGRFAFALSMLLESGYSVDKALENLPVIVENNQVATRIALCRAAMEQGESFASAVEKSSLFSGMYAHILGVGFKTGALDSVTGHIAEIYEEEVDRSISTLVAVIEPVLVAILCVVIGAILLSVMLPLMNIMTAIG